ncbi:MAG: 16S rRNA (adenine(1518)-N(6)/adenine(1519)-N(6))-dimethyltransferase RsmA, partial [Deltaproteobacteria bacterium]|nr:16S rRNA (adenine(1518)-N(6)/adenine(1519)-N(6))-dimethyltransferase RsmA [Deltaproteobacteria bacterium]
TRAVLRRHDLRPKRSWGQNFLVSRRAVATIAARCVDEPGRMVVEIGAGLGTLTRAILAAGGRVVAVERDRDLCRVLEAELGGVPGFELAEADAATFDYAGILEQAPGVIAGNLPYQLTGRILRRISDEGLPVPRAVLTVQEEVAERLAAGPGDKARGALSVMIDARFEIALVMRLLPSAFHPAPRVRSAVIELVRRQSPAFEGVDGVFFDRVVKAAFASRRKTIRNSLVAGGPMPAEVAELALSQAAIDPGIRAEELPTSTFAGLAQALEHSSWQPPPTWSMFFP